MLKNTINKKARRFGLFQYYFLVIYSAITSKGMVTVTMVQTTPDLGVCKVYLSVLLLEGKELLELLESNYGHVRKLVGQNIRHQVRVVPELRFAIDDSSEYSAKIDRLLNDLDIPNEEIEE